MSAEQAPLDAGLVPPWSILGRLPGPVWGIDPSTLRISLAVLGPAVIEVETLSMPPVRAPGPTGRARRIMEAERELIPWFERCARAVSPAYVALEQPFGRTVPVISLEWQGMLMSALAKALWAGPWELLLVAPPKWKLAALGQGRGAAKPPVYRAWGEAVLDRALLEDEAAALGIATWGALEVVGRG